MKNLLVLMNPIDLTDVDEQQFKVQPVKKVSVQDCDALTCSDCKVRNCPEHPINHIPM